VDKGTLAGAGIDKVTANTFLEKLQLYASKQEDSKKLVKVLWFVKGPLENKQIKLDGTKNLLFGSLESPTAEKLEQMGFPDREYITLQGERIAEAHFEIFYN